MKKKRPFLCGVLAMALLGLALFLFQESNLRRPIPPGTGVVTKTVYSLCGHEVQQKSQLPLRERFSLLDLAALYPQSQGWRSDYNGREVVVSRKVEGLCPLCTRKTHLGSKGGFVSVVRGPAGVAGGVVRVTGIRLNDLPDRLRDEALQNRLDLPDEQALLQILDSLNEDSD